MAQKTTAVSQLTTGVGILFKSNKVCTLVLCVL